jgi:subtilisin family serine protease
VKFAPQVLGQMNKSKALEGRLDIPALDRLGIRFGVVSITPQFPGAKKKMYRGRVVDLAGWHEVNFQEDTDVLEAVTDYKALPGVLDAQPVGIHTVSKIPSEEFYNPESPYYYGWHLKQIGCEDVWETPTLAGNAQVIVAIPDTGVRYYHKDLAGTDASPESIDPNTIKGNVWVNSGETANLNDNVDEDGNGYKNDWRGWDFVSKATNPIFYSCTPGEDCSTADNDPRDFNGHGTHCAGIVAALTNNSYAVASVAGGWHPSNEGVKIMPLRIGWSATSFFYGEVGLVEMAYAAQALRYAADNGAKIVSCSWGSSNTGGLADAIDYFLASGGLIFKAAGNDSSTTADYMCSREDVISVAATGLPIFYSPDSLAYFSNYGTWVDICAPGEGILSLWHNHDDPNTEYAAMMDGTSMACPLAAGVAALIWSQDANLTAEQVKTHLFNTADNIDAANPGKEGKLGHGRVNAYRAVTEALPEPPPPPPPPPPSNFLHVGDLDGSSSLVYVRNRLKGWSAAVTVLVHDKDNNPVSEAVVSYTWSGGYSSTSYATTDSAGLCTISTGTISTKKISVTFTVNNVSKTSYTYAVADNHDPDGDSDGTTITINR